jgi:hypothetical protein
MHSIPMQSTNSILKRVAQDTRLLCDLVLMVQSGENDLKSVEISVHLGAPNPSGHSKEERKEMETLCSSLR